MAARVLVTGAAGFFGRHLCAYLHALRPAVSVIAADVAPAVGLPCDDFVVADLTGNAAADELVRRAAPDYVIHLAGTFATGAALKVYQANVLPTVALLEAVCQQAPAATVVTTGSAAEYGRRAENHLPVDETCPCEPVTAYGQSKLMATELALFYHRVHGVRAMVVRPFQLIGQGVTTRLAPGAFAARLKQARATGAATIQVGNLESERDFLDVQDAVEGMWTLCGHPAPGEIFNLCSGRPTRMRDLLQMMIAASGAPVSIVVDPALLRGAADVSTVYGSFEKLRRQCGWQPQRGLEQSVRALLA